MANEKIFSLSFAKVYPCLIAKAQRKGRTKEEVLFLTEWLTGYSGEEIEAALSSDLTYGDFFRSALRHGRGSRRDHRGHHKCEVFAIVYSGRPISFATAWWKWTSF